MFSLSSASAELDMDRLGAEPATSPRVHTIPIREEHQSTMQHMHLTKTDSSKALEPGMYCSAGYISCGLHHGKPRLVDGQSVYYADDRAMAPYREIGLREYTVPTLSVECYPLWNLFDAKRSIVLEPSTFNSLNLTNSCLLTQPLQLTLGLHWHDLMPTPKLATWPFLLGR